jgi:RNA polymerase sigma-70 factor (ECF subfamily)
MAQRLVRAKVKIRDAGIPFRVPERSELPERLEAALDAIYACFTEGWTNAYGNDSCGADMARSELAGEAIYLGRLLTELLPHEPEALGLLALMLYAEARRPARRTAEGKFVPLRMQDARLWDAAMIAEAETALRTASAARQIGRYQLEAAIQSAHIEGVRTGRVAWGAVVSLYDALVQVTESPVARINRAVALAERDGAAAGIESLESASADVRLGSYQPYWAARAYLLAQLGVREAAVRAYEVAIGLERDPAVREYLLERCEELSK